MDLCLFDFPDHFAWSKCFSNDSRRVTILKFGCCWFFVHPRDQNRSGQLPEVVPFVNFCAASHFYRTRRARPLLLAGVESLISKPHRVAPVAGILLRGVCVKSLTSLRNIYIPPGTKRDKTDQNLVLFARFFAGFRTNSAKICAEIAAPAEICVKFA